MCTGKVKSASSHYPNYKVMNHDRNGKPSLNMIALSHAQDCRSSIKRMDSEYSQETSKKPNSYSRLAPSVFAIVSVDFTLARAASRSACFFFSLAQIQ